MILLTQINLEARGSNSIEVMSEEIVAVDAWSITFVRKFMYNGGSEGSKIHINDLGWITVKELMTDIVYQVEAEIHPDEQYPTQR